MRMKKSAFAVVSVLALGGSLAACSSDDAEEAKNSASSAASSATSAASSAMSSASESAKSSTGLTFENGFCKAKPSADKAKDGEMADMTACFGTLVNNTDKDITITGFSIEDMKDEGATFELHEVVDGKMQKKEGGFEIKAGESKELKPGGEHLMVLNLRDDVEPGDDLTIVFETKDGETFKTEVEGREIGAGNESYGSDDHDHDGHDHDHHDHDGHDHDHHDHN
ncbi:copper chaperone PCu(A)C [Corynebacterium sp. 321]|uniref:copper chaperone PCu(A)C n=2 Tax=Corynebacteriaceae TaxID=1653 RepID=UPI001787B080|nr:copper chaperone PCu(A)C [Corynebacterium sp. 321]